MTKKSSLIASYLPEHLHRATKLISQNIKVENVVFLKVSLQIVMINFEQP